ncbi:MAG: DUF3667 domain-containing protein [Bacteroidota bacterium]
MPDRMKEEATAQPRYCRNCHYPLPATAEYCPQCGQKYTTGKVTILQFLKDLVSNLFNLDSKLFKTIGALFTPAKLTQEYFKGRHKRYAHPLRVFLLGTLVFVTALGFNFNSGELNNNMPHVTEMIAEKEWIAQLDTVIPQIKTEQNSDLANSALDTAYVRLYPKEAQKIDGYYFSSVKLSTLIMSDSTEEIRLSVEDIGLSNEELIKKYELDNILDQLLVLQMAKFFRKGDAGAFIRYLIGNVIWILLLVIPFMALWLKLLYIRRPFYYVEHLIFLLHLHAFLFLSFVLLIYLVMYISPVLNVLYLLCMLYAYLSMRRYYQQNHFKTVLKFMAFSLVYFVGLIFNFILVSVVSFLIF